MTMMGDKTPISRDPVATASGETPAVRCGNLLFLTSQTGRDPVTGALADGLQAQTLQMFANVDSLLAAAGGTNADLVMVTLMFADIGYFKAVDVLYADWLPPRDEVPLPTCNAFAAAALPAGALVSLKAVASIGES